MNISVLALGQCFHGGWGPDPSLVRYSWPNQLSSQPGSGSHSLYVQFFYPALRFQNVMGQLLNYVNRQKGERDVTLL